MDATNMGRERHLISFNQRSKEDLAKISSAGGKARAVKMKQQKTFREIFKMLLEVEVPVELLPKKIKDITGVEISFLQAIALATAVKAIRGDVSAAAFVRDTIGEKPKDKLDMDGDFEIVVRVED